MWPVSAADVAIPTVSASLISPISITSGSCLNTYLRAVLKFSVSSPISLWETLDFLSEWTNSIGSSIVTIWFWYVSLTLFIMAASVVDFPLPVVPVTSTSPLVKRAASETIAGRFISSIDGTLMGMALNTTSYFPIC